MNKSLSPAKCEKPGGEVLHLPVEDGRVQQHLLRLRAPAKHDEADLFGLLNPHCLLQLPKQRLSELVQ